MEYKIMKTLQDVLNTIHKPVDETMKLCRNIGTAETLALVSYMLDIGCGNDEIRKEIDKALIELSPEVIEYFTEVKVNLAK